MVHENLKPDVIGEYLVQRRKANGGLMKPGVYAGYRSSLTYLFKRYKVKQDDDDYQEISEILNGVKRHANEARQAGEGNLICHGL